MLIPVRLAILCSFAVFSAATQEPTSPHKAGPGALQAGTGASFLDKGGMRVSAPQLAETVAAADTYVLGPGDVIAVSTVVGNTPQINTAPVGPDGFITIPMIGGVQAAGKTRSQLALEIASKLKGEKIYVDPNVTVNVVDYNSRVVYITGTGISKPGPYPLLTTLKVSELIAKAGGLRDFAKSRDILIVRGKTRFKYNDDEVSKGKNLDQDIQLQPGDHVNVR